MEITIQEKLKKIRAHYGSYLAFCRAWGIHRRTCDEWRKEGHKHDAAAVAFVDAVLRIIELKDELKLARHLLKAVSLSEFEGITCENVDGKNWFDLRDELLNLKK